MSAFARLEPDPKLRKLKQLSKRPISQYNQIRCCRLFVFSLPMKTALQTYGRARGNRKVLENSRMGDFTIRCGFRIWWWSLPNLLRTLTAVSTRENFNVCAICKWTSFLSVPTHIHSASTSIRHHFDPKKQRNSLAWITFFARTLLNLRNSWRQLFSLMFYLAPGCRLIVTTKFENF